MFLIYFSLKFVTRGSAKSPQRLSFQQSCEDNARPSSMATILIGSASMLLFATSVAYGAYEKCVIQNLPAALTLIIKIIIALFVLFHLFILY